MIERHRASLRSLPRMLSRLSDTSLTSMDTSVAASLTPGIWQLCASSAAISIMAEATPDPFENAPPVPPPAFELHQKTKKH